MRQFDRLPVRGVHVRRPPCGCTLLNVPGRNQSLFHSDPLQLVKPLPVIRVVLAFPGAGRRTRDLLAEDADPFVPTEMPGFAKSHDERERLRLPRSIECRIDFVT
jgi:hypothetical protein